jgi:phenylalanyl-tRNA synthetase beta chain
LFAKGALELRNPLSEDHVALRPSLLPGLIQVLARNVRNGAASLRFFELGRVFSRQYATEKRSLGLIYLGNIESSNHWHSVSDRKLDLFDLKGIVETIASVSFRRSERAGLSLSADIISGSDNIGFLGQLNATTAEQLGISASVFVAEMEIRPELIAQSRDAIFSEIERFPAITRDIAMIVPENLSHEKISATIAGANEPLLASIELFDVFSGTQGQNFGAGKKSLAYALTYRNKTRTLTNEEITVVHAKIRERLQRELGVELRE